MTESTNEYKKRIEEIKQSIENEPYMAKMREDIAEGISKTGIRQATVEEQFQSVLDETTGKDVISAPEVILARGSAQTLGERLDSEKAEASEFKGDVRQLEIKKADKTELKITETNIKNLQSQKVDKNGPSQISWAMIAQDAREQISGEKVAVVGEYAVSTANVVDKSVTTSKLSPKSINSSKVDFLETSKNLINTGKIIAKSAITATGDIAVNDNYNIEDYFIEVDISSYYYQKGYSYVAEYDDLKNFITRQDLDGVNGSSFKTSSNTRYIKLVSRLSSPFYENRILSKGTIAIPYEKEGALLSDKIVVKNVKENSITSKHVNDGSVTAHLMFDIDAKKIAFIEKSKIIFYGKVISADGVMTENLTYNTSSKIPVKPLTSIKIGGIAYLALYEKNRFVARIFFPDWLTKQEFYHLPDNIDSVRASYQWNTDVEKKIWYSDGNSEKDTIRLDSDFYGLNRYNEYQFDRYFCDTDISGLFKTNEIYGDFKNPNRFTSAEVIEWFIDLETAHSDYISHEILGQDDFGNDIYLFRAKHNRVQSDVETKQMKFVFVCGTHGHEHASTTTFYLMLKQICEKWQEYKHLEAIKYNVELVFIPVLNQSGWDAVERVNGNGVDLARNYPVFWIENTPGSSQYSGPNPFSEKESQLVRDFLETEKDIDALYDFHNFHTDENGWFVWMLNTGNHKLANMAMSLISQLSRHYKTKYDFIAKDFVGYTSNQRGPMLGEYASKVKSIPLASTIEICQRWLDDSDGEVYDQKTAESAVEMLVNWIVINMRELLI